MGKTREEIENHLFQCNGTDHLYQHLAGLVYTDGLKYLAENAGGGAYWLLDLICSYQGQCRKHPKLAEGFQVWVLKVDLEKKSAVITCGWDSNETVFTQEIELTDFPLEKITIYVENDTICLPQER